MAETEYNKFDDKSGDADILRRVSRHANQMVSGSIGAKMSFGTAVVFMLNSLTGLSLLTLPYGFSQAGLLLGALILAVSMLTSFVTATFMCEALTISNALTYEEAVGAVVAEDAALRGHLHDQREKKRGHSVKALNQNLLARGPTVAGFAAEVRHRNSDREFKIRERIELGQMGEVALRYKGGSKVAALVYIMVLAMTYGTASALTVTVNSSLAQTACSAAGIMGLTETCNQDLVYKYCVVLSFMVVLPLSLANLQNTKKITMVVMSCRFIAIFLMLVVASCKAVTRLNDVGFEKVASTVPLWQPGNWMSVWGNAVFLFGLHHYLPSMISPLEAQKSAPWVIITAFCSCFVLIVLVCATAMAAWGGEDAATCSSSLGGNFCVVQPLYNLNFAPLPWLGGALALFITAYPALAITAIPIAAITTRNTMANWLGLKLPESHLAPANIAMTLAVLGPPSAVALITKDVQGVIKYVGGYAGLTVTFLCPLLLVRGLRGIMKLDIPEESRRNRPLKSPFGTPFGYAFVFVFWLCALAAVTNQLFFQ